MKTALRRGLRLPLFLLLLFVAGVPAAQAQSLTITSATDYGTYSIGEVNLPLTATGGAGALTWSVVGGTPPPGLAIRSDLPPQFAPATTGLSGVATTPGIYYFDVQVSDGVSTVIVQNVTVKITALRFTTPYGLPDAFQGTAYSVQLAATGGVGQLTWAPDAAMPPGLSLAADGTLSGVPSTPGFFPVSVSVTDGTDTIHWSPGVVVYQVQIVTNGLLPYATVNQPYSQPIAVSGGSGGYTLNLSGGLPNGLSFGGGAISGTPTQSGRFTIAVTATDSSNHVYNKDMSLLVVAAPAQLPQVQPYGLRLDDCAVGQQCQRAIGNWTGVQPPISWSASGLPSGMSIRWGSGVASQYVWPDDVELWGSPAAAGDYNVSLTIQDGTGATATNTFPLHVSSIWTGSNPPNGVIGAVYSHTFRVLGGSGAYTGALTGGSLPLGLTFDGSSSALRIAGTPLEGGWFSPQFTFDDGQGHTTKSTMYFYVANAGSASQPLSINDSDLGTATLNAPWQYQLSACCRNTIAWTLESGSLPAGVSLSAGGLLSGTPTAAGQYTFVVRAADGSVPADYTTRQLTVNVTPVFVSMNTALSFGHVTVPYSVQLQASGGTGPYTWTLAPGSFLPPGLSLTAGGLLAGTPSGAGQFTFTINVVDSAFPTHKAKGFFTLSIYPLGQYPPLSIATNGNFGAWSLGALQAELDVTGGAGGYTWSLVGGALPPGLTVRSDFPSWFSSSASGGIIGVATTPGVYNFTLRVTDLANATTDLAGTINVTPLTIKELWSLPDAFKNVAYSYTLTPLGNVGSVTWSANCGNPSCNLPPGLTIDSVTGEIHGTPTTPGFYNPQIFFSADGVTRSVNLSIAVFAVNVGATPQLVNGAVNELPNATQGSAYNVTFTASGGTGPYTFSANSLPNGLSLNAATGVVSGTYNGGTGRFQFKITAADSTATSYTRSFAIRGIAAGVLPALGISGTRLDDCTIGMGCTRSLFVSGGAEAPFTWSASGLPAGMSLRPGGIAYQSFDTTPAGDATLWGVPTELGDFNVTITVTSATGKQASNVFPLHVSELYLETNLPSGTYNTAYGPGGLGTQLRVLGGTASYTATLMAPTPGNRLPIGLSLNAQNTIIGTPLETGSFSPDLQIVDTANPVHRLRLFRSLFIADQGIGTLQINTPSDLGYTSLNAGYSQTFSACCAGSYVWSLESGTLPTGLTPSSLNANTGVLSGTPTAAGTFTFVLRVHSGTDSSNFAIRQFTLTVTPIGISGNTTLLPGDVGTPYSQPLPVTGASGATVWSLMPFNSLPPGLSLSSPGPNGSGSLSGTPTASGQFSFALKVTDASLNTRVATYNLTIYPHLAYPPVTCSTLNQVQGPFALDLRRIELTCGAGGTGTGYQYSLTPGAATVPGMRVQQGPPLPTSFSATTTAGFVGVLSTPGTFPTSIRVTDSLGNFADRTLTVTVSPLQILSQTTLPKARWGGPYSFQLTPYGGSGYSFSLASGSTLPNGLTLNSSGLISGTPTGSTSTATSSFSITLTAAGPLSLTVSGFSLTVNAFDITASGISPAGSGVLPAATVGVAYSQTFLGSGCTGTCSWSVSGQPSTLGIDPATGVLSGTPTSATSTSFTVTRNSTGGNGTVSRVFSLQVVPASTQVLSITSPTATYPAAGSFFAMGTSVAQGLFASGGIPPYSWTLDAGTLPTGVTLQGPGESLGNLSPGVTYLAGRAMVAGTYTFTLKATDTASNFVTRTFTWTVAALNNQYTSLPLSGTITAGTPYTQALLGLGGSATEGTGNYTWANLSPLPLGFALNAATGVLSGTTNETGSFTVPVQITDNGNAAKLVSNVTLTVGGPQGVSFTTGSTLNTAGPGSLFNQSIGVSGGTPFAATPGPSYNITVESPTSLPPGFTLLTGASLPSGFAAGSTALSGTPLTPGTYTFTLRATDSLEAFRLRTFTFTVVPFALATSTNLPDGGVGESYSQRALAWDNANAVTWSVSNGSSLPPGLSLVAGLLTTNGGTLTQAGSFSFSLDATDASGALWTVTFNLKVTGFRITSPQELPQPASVGVPFTYQFTASSAAVWQVNSSLPTGFNLSPGGLLTGTLSSVTSAFSFLVQATAGGVSEVRRFTLYERFPNAGELDVPMASTVLADATVGLGAAYSLTPNGGAPPYSWSVAGGSALPPGFSLVTTAFMGSPASSGNLAGFSASVTLVPGGTVLAGTPSAAGDYFFDLVLTDGLGAQARRTFSLHVSPVVVLQSGLPSGVVNTAYSRQFTAAGGTGPYTFTMRPTALVQDMLPPGLSLTQGGLLSGTPTSTGTYFFILEAKDALNHTFARRYNFIVTNAGALFVSNFNPFDTPVGVGRRPVTLGVSVLNANGSTGAAPGTFVWSVLSGSLPQGMSLLSGGPFGDPGVTLLAGQPTQAGTFVFTLRAAQVGNPSNVADHAFTLRVSPMQAVAPPLEAFIPPDLPPAHVGEFYSTTLKMAGGATPYTFAESPFAPLPSWLTLGSDGVLSGTPTLQAIGVISVSPVVTDGTGKTLNFGSTLVVTSGAGVAAPLLPIPQNQELSEASVSVPYNFPLDFALRGGTGPFTWNVSSGSALPPGLVLLPGANGVSTYLGGTPTTVSNPNPFTFSLDVLDAGSPVQSLTLQFTLQVSPLALTPDTLAPGIVGVAYSALLTPSGGTAPYTVDVYPLADFPPGLTVHSSGQAFVLDGIPASPGNFPFYLYMQDSSGQATGRFYRFAVDNPTVVQPLGEAPAVSVTPTPIEVSYRIGDPNPAPTPFAVNATSATFPFGVSIAGVPGATLSSGTGNAPGASSLQWDMAGVGLGTYHGILGVRAPQAVNLIDQVPVTLKVSVGCSYVLNPTSASAAAAGGSGAFGVATGGDCAWTAVSNDPWITITSASSGTGSATINYTVAPNDAGTPLDPMDDPLLPRTGTINIHGHIYSITQFGSSCAFSISPATLSAPAAGGTAVVNVSASNVGCNWTASGLGASWSNAPGDGYGNGGVTVTIPPNPLAGNIQRTATIAGQVFNVLQSGVGCNVGLSPSTASSPAAGGPGSVFVTRVDGCAYDTVVGPSWVSVTTGGSHDDSLGQPLVTLLAYEVQPNSTTFSRTGTLTIGGRSFEITQEGLPCSVTIDTSNLGSPYGRFPGVVGTIGVAANGPNCSWTAASGADWVSISPQSGGGLSGTIKVSVTSNELSLTSRTTDLSIAGQVVSVVQAGTTCTYGLQSSTGSFPAQGGFGNVGVVAPAVCGWTAVSNDSWLTIVSPVAPGSAGSGNVLFSAAPNGVASTRVGTVSILDPASAVARTYTVTQAPLACSYTLPLAGVTLPSGGTSGSPSQFSFGAAPGCAPTAVSYASWVTVVNPVGAGTVDYLAEPNPTGQSRKGTIQIGDKTFTITEQAAVCGYSLNSYGAAFGQAGGPGVVLGTTTALSCIPDVSTDQPSFITLAVPPTEDPVTHEFTLPYSVLPYISLNVNVRYGNITFGGRVHTVKQTSW